MAAGSAGAGERGLARARLERAPRLPNAAFSQARKARVARVMPLARRRIALAGELPVISVSPTNSKKTSRMSTPTRCTSRWATW